MLSIDHCDFNCDGNPTDSELVRLLVGKDANYFFVDIMALIGQVKVSK